MKHFLVLTQCFLTNKIKTIYIYISAVLYVGPVLALRSKANKVNVFHKRHVNVVSKMTLRLCTQCQASANGKAYLMHDSFMDVTAGARFLKIKSSL